MIYMGIDFGSKRIGLALSLTEEDFALPHKVVTNSKSALTEVLKEAEEKGVQAFVVGESRNYAGEENMIMKDVHTFVQELKKLSSLPVYFEPEFMTSAHAEKTQGKHDLLDASSAALILQSFLDKKKYSGLAPGI